jgi:hypothetical protein
MHMSDALILRSVIDLLDSGTQITWSNKYMLPPGYAWNENGYVITTVPYPFIRACIGLRFSFLIGKLGFDEYVRQNLIALRLLNPNVHKSVMNAAAYSSFKKAGFVIDRGLFDKLSAEVYSLTTVPATLDSNLVSWRRTWFSETCNYDTVSTVVKVENSIKIDADRELMRIDEKYITAAVADFTGFSRRRIDDYWSEKQWSKKIRTLYSLEEAYGELEKKGVTDPTQAQLAGVAGISVRSVGAIVKDMKKLLTNMEKHSLSPNDNEVCKELTE